MTRDDPTSPSTPSAKVGRGEAGSEFAPGAHLGPYRIESLIAAGGCGAVYAARDQAGARVALKILHRAFVSSPEMVARFAREARVVGRIHHPGIVEIFEVAALPDGRPYFAMELLPGQTLRRVVDARGRLQAAEALAYLEPVVDALSAAHRLGVVHRDLKASNVAVLSEGPPPAVKLLDFGIAKLVEPPEGERDLTLRGQRIGTSHAMAPEQVRGEAVDARIDVYALGVLLHFLLTGRYPFESPDALEVERMHLEAPAPRPSASAPVSPALDAVVLRCMEKDRERRYQSAPAFLAALRAAVAVGTPVRPAAVARRALALFIEVSTDDAGDDDVLCASLAGLLDQLEEALLAAGFTLPLQLSTALLAARLLPATPAAAREAASEAVALARRLLERGAGQDPRLKLRIQVHAGDAELVGADLAAGTLSGAIVDFGAWAIPSAGALRLTDQTLAMLEPGGAPT